WLSTVSCRRKSPSKRFVKDIGHAGRRERGDDFREVDRGGDSRYRGVQFAVPDLQQWRIEGFRPPENVETHTARFVCLHHVTLELLNVTKLLCELLLELSEVTSK